MRGSPCECCRRELHYCEEEGHCGEDPPDAACRDVFLIGLGRGGPPVWLLGAKADCEFGDLQKWCAGHAGASPGRFGKWGRAMFAATMDATDEAVTATYWTAPSPGASRGDSFATRVHQLPMRVGAGPDVAHRMGATTIKLSAVPFPESTRFLTRLWNGEGQVAITCRGTRPTFVPD